MYGWIITRDVLFETGDHKEWETDETGTIVFTTWKSTGCSVLEEGKCYTFKNVVTSEWQGRISIKINKNSEILPYQGDITDPCQRVPAQSMGK